MLDPVLALLLSRGQDADAERQQVRNRRGCDDDQPRWHGLSLFRRFAVEVLVVGLRLVTGTRLGGFDLVVVSLLANAA